MRAATFCASLVTILATTGCNLLRFDTMSTLMGTHYRFGTVYEEDSSRTVPQMVKTLKTILPERGFSVRDVKETEESAQFFLTKEGMNHIIDIKSLGTGGCRVHMEAESAGADAVIWSVFNDIRMLP